MSLVTARLSVSSLKVSCTDSFHLMMDVDSAWATANGVTDKDLLRAMVSARCFTERNNCYVPSCQKCGNMRALVEVKLTKPPQLQAHDDATNTDHYTCKCRSNCTSSRLHFESRIIMEVELPRNLGVLRTAPLTLLSKPPRPKKDKDDEPPRRKSKTTSSTPSEPSSPAAANNNVISTSATSSPVTAQPVMMGMVPTATTAGGLPFPFNSIPPQQRRHMLIRVIWYNEQVANFEQRVGNDPVNNSPVGRIMASLPGFISYDIKPFHSGLMVSFTTFSDPESARKAQLSVEEFYKSYNPWDASLISTVSTL